MQVTLELPEEIARYLGDNASRAALEALVLEGLRSSNLSVAQARRILGIRTRFEMDAFLKLHAVASEWTIEEVRRDSETALTFSE